MSQQDAQYPMQQSVAEGSASNSQKVICGSRKRSGGICQNPPMRGATRCRMHGGKSKGGIDSPVFKHGGRSRYIPARWAESVNESTANPAALLQFIDEAAIWEAIVREKLAAISDRDGKRYRESLLADWYEFKVVNKDDSIEPAERVAKAQEILARIGRKIESGASEEDQIASLLEAQDARARFVGAELRRRERENLMVPIEHVFLAFATIQATIREVVTDKGQLARIGERMERMLTVSSSPAVTAPIARTETPAAGSIDLHTELPVEEPGDVRRPQQEQPFIRPPAAAEAPADREASTPADVEDEAAE